jgi:hypothetical protein
VNKSYKGDITGDSITEWKMEQQPPTSPWWPAPHQANCLRWSGHRIVEHDFNHRRFLHEDVQRVLGSIPGRAPMVEHSTGLQRTQHDPLAFDVRLVRDCGLGSSSPWRISCDEVH